MFNSINIIPTEVEQSNHKPLSLYASYFILKEFCKAYIHSFFIDEHKIDTAQIACSQCNTRETISSLLAYAINELDETMIKEIMPLIYNGSIQEITTYLLIQYKKYQIACYNCEKYNDWYIVQ